MFDFVMTLETLFMRSRAQQSGMATPVGIVAVQTIVLRWVVYKLGIFSFLEPLLMALLAQRRPDVDQ